MAVRRQKNWLGQQRVDTTHLREVESAVVGDFDDLAGKVLASSRPIVVAGFTVSMAAAVGNFATQLILNVANGILLHGTASEPGTVFVVSPQQAAETLSTSNTHVTGSFTPNAINYIGIDLIRAADPATADIVKFRSATTLKEFSQQVPLARTLQYRIVISTSDFAQLTNVAPVAKVQLDANGIVTSVTDCREMMFRLGSGGSVPDPLAKFNWPGARVENPVTSTDTTDPFVGADKSIASFVDFFHAMESRLWEVGGGEHWYSQTTDRDVLFIRDTADVFPSSSENFEWTGTNIHWKALSFNFGNSTATRNTIADQTTDSPGLTDLAIGQCIYVDVNRATEAATLTAHKANLVNLGTPAIPGSRHLIAWRTAEGVFGLGQPNPIGFTIARASTTIYGLVKLYDGSNHATGSVVPTVDATYNSMLVPARISSSNGLGASAVLIGSGDTTGPMLFSHGRSDVLSGGGGAYTAGALFEWQQRQSPGAGDNTLLTLTEAVAGAGSGVLRVHDSVVGAGGLLSRLETMTVSNPYGNSAVPVTLTLKNNLAAGSSLADVTVASTTTRVAGMLLNVTNNGTSKFKVEYDGRVTCANVSATSARTNEWAIAATGNGTAGGLYATGGAGGSSGIYSAGTINGPGIQTLGAGLGAGIHATGGNGGGMGIEAYGGAGGGYGVYGVSGGGAAPGVCGINGGGSGAGVFGNSNYLGSTGPGGMFQSFTTRGAINLVPQATPSTPADGDIWVDTSDWTVRAQAGGVTKVLSSTAQAGNIIGAAYITGTATIAYGWNVSSVVRTVGYPSGSWDITFAAGNWPAGSNNVAILVSQINQLDSFNGGDIINRADVTLTGAVVSWAGRVVRVTNWTLSNMADTYRSGGFADIDFHVVAVRMS